MLPAVEVSQLVHHYGQRCALDHLDLEIERGELFAILGPNGGGKTTLFRLLSTLIPVQQGSIRILGHDVASDAALVRARLGVVFQAPSLDRKLTVRENLHYQGPLYGLGGRELRDRASQMLGRLGLTDREHDLVETLSGGLRRRVELAKGLLHRPPLLLLDEPSTGLDPGARSDLWNYLRQIR
ncbi:MAG TPA: ATP-binding cassette domain-containing protein, partial [Pirellulales bacterium]